MGAGHGSSGGTCVHNDEASHSHEEYETGRYILALFLILFASALGCFLPTIRKLREQQTFIMLATAFGTGVILATGFVHMLTPSFAYLSDPCVEELLSSHFGAYTAVFALFGTLSMHFIQIMLSQIALKKSNQVDVHQHHHRHVEHPALLVEGADKDTVETNNNTVQKRLKLLAVYSLEVGIALHSVLIGFTVGITPHDDLTSVTIAIVFHQFLEGFALTTYAIETGIMTKWRTFFLIAFYSLTTPIGVAIGIGVFQHSDPSSPEGKLTIGFLEGICAGILIYDALINLLHENFTACERFYKLSSGKKLLMLAMIWLGAIIMSILEVWA